MEKSTLTLESFTDIQKKLLEVKSPTPKILMIPPIIGAVTHTIVPPSFRAQNRSHRIKPVCRGTGRKENQT